METPATPQSVKQATRALTSGSTYSSDTVAHSHSSSHRHVKGVKFNEADDSPLRALARRIMGNAKFDQALGIVIVLNFVLIVYQTNAEAKCIPLPPEFQTEQECTDVMVGSWMHVAVVVFLIIYTLESSGNFFIQRMDYFKDSWNLLDLFIVTTGWLGEVVPDAGNFQFLRLIRALRIARVFRVLVAVEELYLMLNSLVSMFRSLIVGFTMLFAMGTLWSVVLVEWIHPIVAEIDFEALGCDRCDRAYGGIFDSNLTLWQQLVMGDSWGQLNIPIIEHAPWTSIILCSVPISMVYGLMNQILAIMIQRVQDARDDDVQLTALLKDKEHEHQKQRMLKLCEDLDEDNSQDISMEELLKAWENNMEFRGMLVSMDLAQADLAIVFRVLDSDHSGAISYEEFCDELYKIRSRDIHTMMSLMKLSISELTVKVSTLAPPPSVMVTESEVQKLSEATPQETTLAEEPTLAGKLFSELFPGDAAPFGSLVQQMEELDGLKRSIALCVEEQVASLLVTLSREWVPSRLEGGLADGAPALGMSPGSAQQNFPGLPTSDPACGSALGGLQAALKTSAGGGALQPTNGQLKTTYQMSRM